MCFEDDWFSLDMQQWSKIVLFHWCAWVCVCVCLCMCAAVIQQCGQCFHCLLKTSLALFSDSGEVFWWGKCRDRAWTIKKRLHTPVNPHICVQSLKQSEYKQIQSFICEEQDFALIKVKSVNEIHLELSDPSLLQRVILSYTHINSHAPWKI